LKKLRVIRVKEIPNGYSVFVTDGIRQQGFSFSWDEGVHDEVNGVPKYMSRIKEEFERLDKKDKELKKEVVLKKVKNVEGKTFKF